MDANELDALIVQRLPEWFEPEERFSGAEVFALVEQEAQSRVTPDEVSAALERLARREGSGLRRLHARYAALWERLYTRERPPGGC